MKKKYSKPELRKLNPPIPRGPVIINGKMWDLTITPNFNPNPLPHNLNYSHITEPEIRFNPADLPESVSILGPKCPKCGTRTQEMVLYGVMEGNSLSKNHCGKCGYNWGDDTK